MYKYAVVFGLVLVTALFLAGYFQQSQPLIQPLQPSNFIQEQNKENTSQNVQMNNFTYNQSSIRPVQYSDVSQRQYSNGYNQNNQVNHQDNEVNPNTRSADGYPCSGSGSVNFTASPMKLEDINFISPLGRTTGSHVTPSDHQYYYAKSWKPSSDYSVNDLLDVYSPADGTVGLVQSMGNSYKQTTNPELGDYRLVIYHTCTFYTIYIHLYQLSPKLQPLLDARSYPGQDVRVKSGELIGKAVGLDFNAYDDNVKLNGFVVPEHYKSESWKIHVVDSFDYFTEPLKSQLLEKNVRTAIPTGGKIDYDVDGKLIGNWFVENTGGYAGGQNNPEYWKNHFAFVPDYIDPSHFIISMGNFAGAAKQFGVKGNGPNPSEVSVSTGLVKYELVPYEYYTPDGQHWDRISLAQNLKIKDFDNSVEGVVLAQLIDTRKLKLEIFPNKTANEVSSFTSNAIIYER